MEDVTTLTGITTFAFVLGVPSAVLLSLLLTYSYRRSVVREMLRRGQSALPAAQPFAPTPLPAARAGATNPARGADWSSRRAKAAAVFFLGGVAYSTLSTALMFGLSETEFLPFRTLLVTTTFFMPFLVVLLLFFVPSRAAGVLVVMAYLACLLAPSVVSEHWYDPFIAWILWGAVPTALAVGSLWRRVRAVGALSLSFTLLVIVSANLGISWLSGHIPSVAGLGAILGLDAVRIVLTILACGAAVGALFAWGLLRLLGNLYAARRLSDQTLIAYGILVVFSLFFAMDIVFAAKSASYFPAAFVPLVTSGLGMFVLRRWLIARNPSRPLALLYLRVFSDASEGPALFRALSKSWRYVGSIRLIGGPDLATTTLEPHRFLDFLSGRLAGRFISDPAGLERVLAAFDARPDAEGRYPVDELYCRDDTWQQAFTRLSEQCDAILMDLRGFTRQRSGAKFELAALAARGELARSVLIVDADTDEQLVAETIAGAGVGRPGIAQRLRVDHGHVEQRALMGQLLAAVGQGR